jgi:hypothetical protein
MEQARPMDEDEEERQIRKAEAEYALAIYRKDRETGVDVIKDLAARTVREGKRRATSGSKPLRKDETCSTGALPEKLATSEFTPEQMAKFEREAEASVDRAMTKPPRARS